MLNLTKSITFQTLQIGASYQNTYCRRKSSVFTHNYHGQKTKRLRNAWLCSVFKSRIFLSVLSLNFHIIKVLLYKKNVYSNTEEIAQLKRRKIKENLNKII